METRDRNVIVDLEDGTKLGIRIDNWALKETQKKSGCRGMIDLLTRIGIDDGNIDVEVFTILLMEAANEYNFHQKIEKEPITVREACALIDEMGGIIQAYEKVTEAFKQYIPKNSPAPQKKGRQKKISQ
jgi:hypothetical protein